MSEEEAKQFENDPLFDDILKMRTFDEQALKPGRQVLQLEDYQEMIKKIIDDGLHKPIKVRTFKDNRSVGIESNKSSLVIKEDNKLIKGAMS